MAPQFHYHLVRKRSKQESFIPHANAVNLIGIGPVLWWTEFAERHSFKRYVGIYETPWSKPKRATCKKYVTNIFKDMCMMMCTYTLD